MNLDMFLDHLNKGLTVDGGSEAHEFMHKVSQEALRITSVLNNTYQSPEEIRKLFSELTGKPVDASFGLFPPFYTDCGKNITVGKNVFINSGCRFQDRSLCDLACSLSKFSAVLFRVCLRGHRGLRRLEPAGFHCICSYVRHHLAGIPVFDGGSPEC